MQNVKVTLQDDGFTISVSHHEIQPGDALIARVELPGRWETQELSFEVNTHTGFFRHPAMFVYTGQTPTRVLVQCRNEVIRPVLTTSTRLFDSSRYNFASYPAANHRVWDDDDYLPFWLGTHYSDSSIDSSLVDRNYFPGGGSSGGGGATGSFAPEPSEAVPASADDSSGVSFDAAPSAAAAIAGAEAVETSSESVGGGSDSEQPGESGVESEPDAYVV
jgi:hypothetical protein